jgi:hypothetical protein
VKGGRLRVSPVGSLAGQKPLQQPLQKPLLLRVLPVCSLTAPTAPLQGSSLGLLRAQVLQVLQVAEVAEVAEVRQVAEVTEMPARQSHSKRTRIAWDLQHAVQYLQHPVQAGSAAADRNSETSESWYTYCTRSL